MVIQHNGSRRGFQQSPVSLVRLAQFHFRDPALARDKPGGPDGQKDRCRHSTADVEIVQRDVIQLAEEAIFHQFPKSKHQGHDGGAGKYERYPEPPPLL